MSSTSNPIWIGALTGLVIVAAAVPAGFAYWNAYSKDRAETRGELTALVQRLDKTNQALLDMQKAASLAGVTRQLDELNTRIKITNEALAELQKTSAGIQRASLDKIADRLDHIDGDLKANADAVSGMQKSVPLANLSRQIGQVQANLTALDVSLAGLKKTSLAADSARRFDTLESAVKALDGRLGEIKTALDGNQTAIAELKSNAPESTGSVQLASTADALKKGLGPDTAARGAMDLIVIHAEPAAGSNGAQTKAAAAMAPLGFEFQRVGASDDKAQTDAIAAKLKDLINGRSKCAVSVAGYADTVGSDEFNLALSKQRAHNVAARLRQTLGDDVQIAETGWGDRRLQVWTPDNTPKTENRRVDIAVRCEG